MNIKSSTSQNAGRALRAFTLVEVIVSAGLLGIMMIVIYPAFIFGFASVKTTREDERATQIVTQKLEAIRLCTWAQLTNYPATFKDYYNPLGLTNNTAGAVYYGTMSTTAPYANLTTESYKSQVHLITMSVTWTNYIGKVAAGHTRQMQTLSAYYGLQNYIWGAQ